MKKIAHKGLLTPDTFAMIVREAVRHGFPEFFGIAAEVIFPPVLAECEFLKLSPTGQGGLQHVSYELRSDTKFGQVQAEVIAILDEEERRIPVFVCVTVRRKKVEYEIQVK